MKNKKILSAIIILLTIMLITGCQLQNYRSISGSMTENEEAQTSKTTYLTRDVAIVTNVKEEEGTLEYISLIDGSIYSLSYDGVTLFYNQFGEAISVTQVMCGSIMENTFDSKTGKLISCQDSKECVNLKGVNDFTIDAVKQKMSIYGTDYAISSRMVVMSGKKKTDISNIESVDILSVWIYKNVITSINVEQGHGYLSLKNEDYFINGWIEAGEKIVTKIKKDMKLAIPEGDTTVIISKGRNKIVQKIEFVRDEQMVWDLSNVFIAEEKRPRKVEKTKETKEKNSTEESEQEESVQEETKQEKINDDYRQIQEEINSNLQTNDTDDNSSSEESHTTEQI